MERYVPLSQINLSAMAGSLNISEKELQVKLYQKTRYEKIIKAREAYLSETDGVKMMEKYRQYDSVHNDHLARDGNVMDASRELYEIALPDHTEEEAFKRYCSALDHRIRRIHKRAFLLRIVRLMKRKPGVLQLAERRALRLLLKGNLSEKALLKIRADFPEGTKEEWLWLRKFAGFYSSISPPQK